MLRTAGIGAVQLTPRKSEQGSEVPGAGLQDALDIIRACLPRRNNFGARTLRAFVTAAGLHQDIGHRPACRPFPIGQPRTRPS
jgi:hypothetical protein